MAIIEGRGDLIGGRFVPAKGDVLRSEDPAHDFAPVYETQTRPDHVDAAVDAARRAAEPWADLSTQERVDRLQALRACFVDAIEEMADAIVRETGKPLREARGEAGALAPRIDLMATDGLARIETLRPSGVLGEARAHPQGVLAVIGPYNYPAHLINAHVIPALMSGNTVVIKPSEACPYSGEVYAKACAAAGLPPGVVNMVQGGADVGRALVAHPEVDGVLFTGSFQTGRAITETCLDQPHKILALELGGKNAAVILNDANLSQALAGVVQGAFLTAGQRCTATSRVLVQRGVADAFIDALTRACQALRPGDPLDDKAPFGPLANRRAFERFCAIREGAAKEHTTTLVAGETLDGGAYVTPSLHLLEKEQAPGYLDTELFGPDLCVELVDDLDHAIDRLRKSPYGLSNSLFSADDQAFEHFYRRTRSGLCNHNRSTNGASGKLPFGGVGMSGNQRPAGVDAMRYTTYPVAILREEPRRVPVDGPFKAAVAEGDLALSIDAAHLAYRHDVEAAFERHRIPVQVRGPNVTVPQSAMAGLRIGHLPLTPKTLASALGERARVIGTSVVMAVPNPAEEPVCRAFEKQLRSALGQIAASNPGRMLGHKHRKIRIPKGGHLPRSEVFLRRLYEGGKVPVEKKTPVVDLLGTEGPILRSVDDEPLAILDAASQISSLGLGFQPSCFSRALDEGELGDALLANPDTTQPGVSDTDARAYADFLLEHTWDGLRYASFTSGGSEANEKALDLCRLNGPGGRTVVAFEGSFHGRTLASLHCTYNPVKREPFEFEGYQARFVPFPANPDPRNEPAVDDAWVSGWAKGEVPAHNPDDPLVSAEVNALQKLREAIDAGDVCAVLAEPFQGEGGDNYVTARFMNGVLAICRATAVPLIFDEVQSGFGLSGTFWWHTRFALRDKDGNPDGPDCVTSAKKAQLGVVLSRFEDPRPGPVHMLQALRGHRHAVQIAEEGVGDVENTVRDHLWSLTLMHPNLVENPRCQGFAFAFDLPSKNLANQLIAQRFYRGFMAYIAGERTVRFRLNTSWSAADIKQLFSSLRACLDLLHTATTTTNAAGAPLDLDTFKVPSWADPRTDRRSTRAKTPAGYEERAKDRPGLLAWLLSLPRGPLERVADRMLAVEGMLPDAAVNAALDRLLDGSSKDATQSQMIAAFEKLSAKVSGAKIPAGAYKGVTSDLEVDPAHLLAEALAARPLRITLEEWEQWADQIVAIEDATYEEGRRESREQLRSLLDGEGAIGILLCRRTDGPCKLLGYAFGGPLELYDTDGPAHDVMRGQNNTFYSSNITVHPGARGAGLGKRLKRAQVLAAQRVRNDDGSPRYLFMTGRNRVGQTEQMGAINRAFGAYEVEHFRGNQYGDLSGHAVYYRQPLRRPQVPTALRARSSEEQLVWSASVQAPRGARPEAIARALEDGSFTGAVGTKLTLSNWVTPDMVRYTELVGALAPRGLPHMYFTSGRDELVDKGLRALRCKRTDGQQVIGLERQFLGTTTAAARSLTDPAGQAQPFGWYDWPLVPHPSEVGSEASIGAIVGAIGKLGPQAVLGMVVELVGEKSGHVVDPAFIKDLGEIRDDTGVPLVFVETAASLSRAGDAVFYSDLLDVRPNMVWWYAGAQLGHIFCDDETYVDKPLTLISTWDGDEVSALRTRHHLLAADQLRNGDRREAFGKALQEADIQTRGAGLWRVLDLGDDVERVIAACAERGLLLGRGLPGLAVLCPPIDVADAEIERGVAILQEVLK